MPLTIYAKPGTHPARYMRVKHKRKPPKVGDLFKARDTTACKYARWDGFYVHEIRDVGGQDLYILEYM
jgi:hypothetical protein